MMNYSILKILILILLFVNVSIKDYAQIRGMIKEEGSKEPLEFVNITLISQMDSSVITKVFTDSTGHFAINKNVREGRLIIRLIGYETYEKDVENNQDIGTIFLKKRAFMLKGITVKTPSYRHISGGIATNITGLLSKLGYASDVLKYLPFVTQNGNQYKVMGKGTPVIYINDRLLRDESELKQLSSSDIKEIQVLTDPGAEYDATTNAVIRIITKNHNKRGIAVVLNGGASYERQWSNHEEVTVNYHKNKMNLFCTLNHVQDRTKDNQTTKSAYLQRNVETAIKRHSKSTSLYGTIGMDYQDKDKLSFGAQYQYTGMPNFKSLALQNIDSYRNMVMRNNLRTKDEREWDTDRHHINAYLNYNFTDKSYLKIDIDYLNGGTTSQQYYESGKNSLYSLGKTDNLLYAARLIWGLPFFYGDMKMGLETSYTQNNNQYNPFENTTLENALQANKNKSVQKLGALFVQYNHRLGKYWEGRIGGRLEDINFSYYDNGKKSADIGKRYVKLYPSASMTYNTDDLQLSLDYRNSTYRPNYFALRSSVQFNNPYSYEGGNPGLQPQKTNMFSLSCSWKDIQLMTNYSIIKNGIMYIVDMYNGNDSITVFQPRNIKQYRVLDISVFYSPVWFKVWKPTFSVNLSKPYLTYNTTRYNKPVFYVGFYNLVELPHQLLLGMDFSYNTSGNMDSDIAFQFENFCINAYCIKTFLKDKLRIKFSVSNIFNTSREKWSKNINNISLYKWNDGGRRTFELTVSYRINQFKTKYKGEASTDELKRL